MLVKNHIVKRLVLAVVANLCFRETEKLGKADKEDIREKDKGRNRVRQFLNLLEHKECSAR